MFNGVTKMTKVKVATDTLTDLNLRLMNIIMDDQIDKLVAIKSKDEVIGDIISLLQSPIKNVVSSLQSGGGKLSGILKSLSEK